MDLFAGVFSIFKQAVRPIKEIATQKKEAKKKFLFVRAVIKAAKNVPMIIARNVKEVRIPFAFGIIFLGTISGMIPYLEGPKTAL